MRPIVVAALLLSLCSPALADDIPQFQVDPFWPKPLPNSWILGQVAGIATDKYDRVWVVQRPLSLTPRERAAEQNPPEAKCCNAAMNASRMLCFSIARSAGFASEGSARASAIGSIQCVRSCCSSGSPLL